jgi:DNA polymerase-4
MAKAIRLCPHCTFLPVRMGRYKEVSKAVFDIFLRFTPLVEPISLDEAFLDVTDSIQLFGTPVEIAKRIKRAVVDETGLTVSAGVAPSKFLAKIASDLRKPDGLTIVPPDGVKAFLDPLPIDKVWGVGKATQKALHRRGVRTIGDLSRLPVEVLKKQFGKHGKRLFRLSQGIDERDVEPLHEPKSIGHEKTFSEDILSKVALERELLSLATKVSSRMRGKGLEASRVTLKVKYSNFVQITRSVTRHEATADGGEIFSHCCQLLEKTEAGKKPIRLLGISMSHLKTHSDYDQLSLFDTEAGPEKTRRLHLALDRIHDRFGEEAIIPGTLLKD